MHSASWFPYLKAANKKIRNGPRFFGCFPLRRWFSLLSSPANSAGSNEQTCVGTLLQQVHANYVLQAALR